MNIDNYEIYFDKRIKLLYRAEVGIKLMRIESVEDK